MDKRVLSFLALGALERDGVDALVGDAIGSMDGGGTDGRSGYRTLGEAAAYTQADVQHVVVKPEPGEFGPVHPDEPPLGGKPTMFICGDDEAAKKEVSAILVDFGWEPEDVGFAASARALEPLCQLWCAPGLLRNQWTHAFHLLKLEPALAER